MRILLHVFCCTTLLTTSAFAGGSFLLPDGINRAPAIALHCVGVGNIAVPCGTAISPLVVSSLPSAGASSSSNQVSQLAIEASTALVLGATTDASFTGGPGSLVSLLKGLWTVLGTGVPALPVGGQLTSRTINLVALQSTSLFSTNLGRKYLSFQVPQSTYVWINLMGGAAAPNAPDCAFFAAGTFYESGQFVNRGAITVYAPAAVTLSAWEG